MPTIWPDCLQFRRAGMGNVDPYHSVRPQGHMYNVGVGEGEDMAEEKQTQGRKKTWKESCQNTVPVSKGQSCQRKPCLFVRPCFRAV